MKYLSLFFVPIIFTTSMIAQKSSPSVELFFITENVSSSPIYTFTLTAQAQCWSIPIPAPPVPGGYFLTDDHDNPTYVPEQHK